MRSLANDVWIGAEAMIIPGLKIADGAVIGACSLVTKNVGSYEIWGGNSAQLIKNRFSDEELEKLLAIKWWDFSVEQITANVHELWNKFRHNQV